MNGFTEKEILALQEFRSRVSDVLPNDDFSRRDDSLIRWIRAREMDLDKAEDMIRNSMKWRSENKVDTILDTGIASDLLLKLPYHVDGIDRKGRPVLSIAYGAWDIRTFIETEGVPKFVHYSNQMLERIGREIRRRTYENEKNGNDDDELSCVQFIMLSDMTGYSYRQLANLKTVQSIIQTVSVYEAHYPETMAKCIVINAPSIFSILFGMMKPFMSARTIDKIQIFSDKKEQWQPVILDLVDPCQLREQYGGTKI